MKTQIVIIAIMVFLTPKISFAQVTERAYNYGDYTVVPIDLQYFNAQNKDNEVLVSWSFNSEMMNAIELQKSFNDRDFVSIVGFKNDASFVRFNYTFLDNTPFKNAENVAFNTVYYRLKQIDANHIFEYSKVIAVRETNEIGMASASLTPKSYQFTPKGVTPPQTFSIVNVAGQVMMNGRVKDTEALDIRKLPAGFYTLNVESIKFKFLKN
jgi:hypothetical protein